MINHQQQVVSCLLVLDHVAALLSGSSSECSQVHKVLLHPRCFHLQHVLFFTSSRPCSCCHTTCLQLLTL